MIAISRLFASIRAAATWRPTGGRGGAIATLISTLTSVLTSTLTSTLTSALTSLTSTLTSALTSTLTSVAICAAICAVISATLLAPLPAQASLTDDTYDGNIFALYAGNGSLVPPRTTLSMAFDRQRPALLLFYVDDSRDCKQFSSVYSQLQAYYGRAADFLPLSVDTLELKSEGDRANPATYYRGVVPQLVIFDQAGQVVFDEAGQVPFESIDDRLRDVFDLLPRSESVELRRRSFNEVNTELVPE